MEKLTLQKFEFNFLVEQRMAALPRNCTGKYCSEPTPYLPSHLQQKTACVAL